jgi:hypothetical protein
MPRGKIFVNEPVVVDTFKAACRSRGCCKLSPGGGSGKLLFLLLLLLAYSFELLGVPFKIEGIETLQRVCVCVCKRERERERDVEIRQVLTQTTTVDLLSTCCLSTVRLPDELRMGLRFLLNPKT